MSVATEEFKARTTAALARLLLAAAAPSPFQRVLDGTKDSSAAQKKITDAQAEKARAAYLTAVSHLASLIERQVASHPEMTFIQVMSLPAVTTAIHMDLAEAYRDASAAMVNAYAQSTAHGLTQAQRELRLLGVAPVTVKMDPTDAYLTSVLGDLDRRHGAAANLIHMAALRGAQQAANVPVDEVAAPPSVADQTDVQEPQADGSEPAPAPPALPEPPPSTADEAQAEADAASQDQADALDDPFAAVVVAQEYADANPGDAAAQQAAADAQDAADEEEASPEGDTGPAEARASKMGSMISQQIMGVAQQLAFGAATGASVVAEHSYGSAKDATYAAANEAQANGMILVTKVWVCSFYNSCPTCVAMHGQEVATELMFPEDITFSDGEPDPTYGDGLDGPPIHPWCGCEIVCYLPDSTGPSPESMRAFARSYAESAPKMAPRSWPSDELSGTARTTDMLLASDVRAMSEAKYQTAIDAFQACILHTYGSG